MSNWWIIFAAPACAFGIVFGLPWALGCFLAMLYDNFLLGWNGMRAETRRARERRRSHV